MACVQQLQGLRMTLPPSPDSLGMATDSTGAPLFRTSPLLAAAPDPDPRRASQPLQQQQVLK